MYTRFKMIHRSNLSGYILYCFHDWAWLRELFEDLKSFLTRTVGKNTYDAFILYLRSVEKRHREKNRTQRTSKIAISTRIEGASCTFYSLVRLRQMTEVAALKFSLLHHCLKYD